MAFLTGLATMLPPSLIRLLKPLAMPLVRKRMRCLYPQFISPGDLVFDVGAHTGDMAMIFLELGARVVCIEPQPSSVAELKRKFGNNPDVRIVDKGVGEHGGTLPLSVCSSAPSLSTFSAKWKTGRFSGRKWDQAIEVPVTTLESLVEQFGRPAFCKLDVEGFELQALRGLHSKIRHLSFEFTKEFLGDARLCASHLSSLGKASFNFSPYSEFRLNSEEWLGMDDLFRKLESVADRNLCGNIYVRLE